MWLRIKIAAHKGLANGQRRLPSAKRIQHVRVGYFLDMLLVSFLPLRPTKTRRRPTSYLAFPEWTFTRFPIRFPLNLAVVGVTP